MEYYGDVTRQSATISDDDLSFMGVRAISELDVAGGYVVGAERRAMTEVLHFLSSMRSSPELPKLRLSNVYVYPLSAVVIGQPRLRVVFWY